MCAMKLHLSNRLEILAGELARVVAEPLDSPFAPEIIVVQSRGMERWVSMQLAQHHGICANCRFPFPNALVHELFRKVHTGLPEISAYDPEYLTWRIMQLLPPLLQQPGFETLRRYLGDGPWGLRHLQLSRSIAETFDQYLLYRPDWISRWENGEEDHWQAELWRRLAGEIPEKHRAAVARQFFEKLQGLTAPPSDFPQRISVFGISYLPPFHLHVLHQVAQCTDVHLYLLNPCAEYWGDIASRRDLRRLEKVGALPLSISGQTRPETGNSLLASMGVMGRDFFDLLLELDAEQEDHFSPPQEGTLLSRIQSDIFHLRESNPGGENAWGTDHPSRDRSLEILSCHGPMREVEVLHDHLLELFENDPALMPGDILVMMPDIEAYAPFVHAVFGAPQSPRRRIPYSISDKSMRGESAVMDTFLSVLELSGHRFSAPQVMGILESRPVQARFGLEEGDLDTLIRWVGDTRIRWGWDETDRNRWCEAAGARNTWRAGLDRLLLGYALPGRGIHLFQGILPYDDLEGSEVQLLGKFLDFLETLREFLESLEKRRTLSEWTDCLSGFCRAFFQPDPGNTRDLQALREVLEHLGELENISGFQGELNISTVSWHLRRRLEGGTFGFGFMTGGVTFCSMLPMRSIPFKVIGLLGMDVNAYPRQPRNPEFDLMAGSPRKGDRSPRNDDRYLFLETLLSAREKLLIIYSGQSQRDNSLIPPSVLVSELLDYAARILGCDPKQLITRHRLQPFSPEYFKESDDLFSYSQTHCLTAGALLREKGPKAPFLSAPLPPPAEAWRRVELSEVKRFFSHPCRHFFQRRLGLFLEDATSALEDTEPFQLEGLEKYGLEQDLLRQRMEGVPWECLKAARTASGDLPHGRVGDWALEKTERRVERFLSVAEPFLKPGPLEPLTVALSVGGFDLRGTLARVYPSGLVRARLAKVKGKDLLDLWIDHLVLNALEVPEYPRRSILVGLQGGNGQALELAPVENAALLLQELLEIYWRGLSAPLHLFPQASWMFASKIVGGSDPEKALTAARREWADDWKRGAESDDPYYRMAFEGQEPLDGMFEELALQVFQPLLGHLGMDGPPDPSGA